MKTKIPTIQMKEIGKREHYLYEVNINSEEQYREICKKARNEIPDEEIFNWWMNQALKETIEYIKNMTPFHAFCWKWKIRLLRLVGRI